MKKYIFCRTLRCYFSAPRPSEQIKLVFPVLCILSELELDVVHTNTWNWRNISTDATTGRDYFALNYWSPNWETTALYCVLAGEMLCWAIFCSILNFQTDCQTSQRKATTYQLTMATAATMTANLQTVNWICVHCIGMRACTTITKVNKLYIFI